MHSPPLAAAFYSDAPTLLGFYCSEMAQGWRGYNDKFDSDARRAGEYCMSLLNPPADKPDRSRAMAFTVAALVLVAIVALWYNFRYYPEKRAAEHFFAALVAGNTTQAYQLWKPGPTYAMKDFLADWGPQGYYGPVKSYKLIHAKAPNGSNAISVSVEVSPFSPMPDISDTEKSRKTKVVEVWVLAADKSFSFPVP
jgi:hypothetical protein